jgi:hypothetical protein
VQGEEMQNSENKTTKQKPIIPNSYINTLVKSGKGTEASLKATELRKGGNRADGVLRRFD